ncbi:metallophosphoesterase [uncultured Serinicoccus sp.]|uniref:metallophosphoesterase family protein n=1 Tax=uncultured Serinicoccus sp. TaxID=735514 RepID=UPI00262166EE|nr:metallophosphoesterase [uncultured Serinicoccus sp.]
MVRILHTADWQIGLTRRFLEPEAQARFSAARVEAIRALGRVAQEQGCALVVVSGDVFESNHLTGQTVRRALEALRAVPVPVYLLPGNHDPLDAASVYRSDVFTRECPPHVHVLDAAGVHEVAPGLELVAAPWESKHPGRDLVGEAVDLLPEGPAPDGVVRVVVGHGGVDDFDPQWRDAATIRTASLAAALDEGRVHYVALGDRHSRTAVAGREDIHYPGAPEPTRETEVDPGHALVVDVDPGRAVGERVQVTPHPVATWRFLVLEREVDTDADLDALDAELRGLVDKDRTVLFLNLRGTLTVAQHARLEELRERHRDHLGAMVEREQHRQVVVVSDDEVWRELGLGGYLAAAVDEMQSQALEQPQAPAPAPASGDGFVVGRADDEESARDALSLLYRLSRSRS